jgi:hypothetical protein
LNFFLFQQGYEIFPQLAYIGFILLMFSVFGIIYLARAKKVETLILFSPLLIGLVLAIAYILPYNHRVGLYASWPFIISGMAGIAAFQQWQPRIFRPALSVPLAMFIGLTCILILVFVPFARPPLSFPTLTTCIEGIKKTNAAG